MFYEPGGADDLGRFSAVAKTFTVTTNDTDIDILLADADASGYGPLISAVEVIAIE